MVQVGDYLYTVEVEIGTHIFSYYECLFTANSTLVSDFTVLDGFTWGLVSST